MANEFDNTLKSLIYKYPQDFVSWLLPGAIFIRFLATEFKKPEFAADILMEVKLCDKLTLLEIELQSTDQEEMEDRVLRYNVLAEDLHEDKKTGKGKKKKNKKTYDVWSSVIFMHKAKKIPQPPFIKRLANGWEAHRFSYTVKDLSQMEAQEFLGMEHKGLWPLIPLTKDGKNREVIDQMIEAMVKAKRQDLLIFGKMVAELAYKTKEEKEWLRRRFELESIHELLKHSPTYREIRKSVREELKEERKRFKKLLAQKEAEKVELLAQQKAREELLAQQQAREAELLAQQQADLLAESLAREKRALLVIAQARFPEIARMVEKQIELVKDSNLIEDLLVKVAMAQDAQAVIQALIELSQQESKQ